MNIKDTNNSFLSEHYVIMDYERLVELRNDIEKDLKNPEIFLPEKTIKREQKFIDDVMIRNCINFYLENY